MTRSLSANQSAGPTVGSGTPLPTALEQHRHLEQWLRIDDAGVMMFTGVRVRDLPITRKALERAI